MIDYRSDNTGRAAPQILEALVRANHDTALGYGADEWTAALQRSFSDLFETAVRVFPVATGTAAGVSHSEHNRLPAARLAGISGGAQVRTAQKPWLAPAMQLYRGGVEGLVGTVFGRYLHSCMNGGWIGGRDAGDPLGRGRNLR